MKKQNLKAITKKKELSLQEKAIKATNARSEESDTHNSDWNPGSLKRLNKALKEESQSLIDGCLIKKAIKLALKKMFIDLRLIKIPTRT